MTTQIIEAQSIKKEALADEALTAVQGGTADRAVGVGQTWRAEGHHRNVVTAHGSRTVFG